MNNYGVKFDLPEELAEKAAQFPESSYGANLVTLVLKDARQVPHVSVAGRSVIKAREASAEALLSSLNPSDIVDVLSEV
ncbi:MAG TPA: hypothetical protein VFN26_12585 [Candidatus Acidoferrum sp.]|nr:hypothetical protein [Candidatus Acidoferrum sp.]